MVPQLTTAMVPVGELADPAAVEVGETASSGTGGSEVDADLVQVQAPRDIGSVVHPAPSYDQHLDCTVSEFSILTRAGGCVLAARSATFIPSCLPSIGNAIVVGDDA